MSCIYKILSLISLFLSLYTHTHTHTRTWGFSGSLVVKNLLANTGDTGLIPGSGRSPGEGNGNPF